MRVSIRTLNLKRRLREERGLPEPSRPNKSKTVVNALSTTRLGNSGNCSITASKLRRPLFDPEVDGPAIGIPTIDKNKKKDSKTAESTKKVETVSKSKAKGKAKNRPAMEAAFEAFADSPSEKEESENEVETNLVIDEEEIESPVKKSKGKGRVMRSKKRKSDEEEDEYVEKVERPVKRIRRAIF